VNVHEQTSWSSFTSVFRFIQERYEAVTTGGSGCFLLGSADVNIDTTTSNRRMSIETLEVLDPVNNGTPTEVKSDPDGKTEVMVTEDPPETKMTSTFDKIAPEKSSHVPSLEEPVEGEADCKNSKASHDIEMTDTVEGSSKESRDKTATEGEAVENTQETFEGNPGCTAGCHSISDSEDNEEKTVNTDK
ncbi:hypothetical protein SK128_014199, partial [Halocaridina rubra]